jgi:hypothetical protein
MLTLRIDITDALVPDSGQRDRFRKKRRWRSHAMKSSVPDSTFGPTGGRRPRMQMV